MRAVLLACLAVAAAACPARGQDALQGRRLYHEVGRLSDAGVSCIDCHGGVPGALHGPGRAADSPATIECAVGAVEAMSPPRGRLSAKGMADIPACVARPSVLSPEPRVTTSGPAVSPYANSRLEFVADGAASGTIRLTNAGGVALRTVAGAALEGAHAALFVVKESTCDAGVVLQQGQSCAVTIAFHPDGALGLRTAVLRLAHD